MIDGNFRKLIEGIRDYMLESVDLLACNTA